MRFNLRLHGRTGDGAKCVADVSVYASSQKALQTEAMKASKAAAWRLKGGTEEWVPEGSRIVVERVESLRRPTTPPPDRRC